MTLFRPLALVAALSIVAGCTVENGQYVTGKKPPEQQAQPVVKQAGDVTLFAGTPKRAYTVIGPVDVAVNKLTAFHPNPSVEQAEIALREEAAALGADAVINVKIGDVGVSMMSWGTRKAEGTAIRF